MNCNPTITAEEFKTIHNAVCDLDSLCFRLEEVLKPELYMLLAKARDNIRKGLEGAYEQDNATFDRKNDHYSAVGNQRKFRSTWSMFEVDDLTSPYPFKGVNKVVYLDHWGPTPVESEVKGFTWTDLWAAADACISKSGDGHHIFIECFTQKGDTLVLSTGS